MKLKMGMVLASVLVLISACSKNADETKEAFTADAQRALGEPRFAFVPQGQNLKLSALASSEKSALASCTEKSTADRIDRKKYSVGYGIVERLVMGGQKNIKSVKMEYTTDTKDEMYELTTGLLEFVIADQNILESGGISFIDSCTKSGGCNQEKRRFLSGSARMLLTAKDKENDITEKIAKLNKYECKITESQEEIDQVQKGSIQIGNKSYPAIQVYQKSKGKVYCRSGREDLYLGEGYKVNKVILLQDELPTIKDTVVSGEFRDFANCDRTVVFVSSDLQFEGNSMEGASMELVDYSLTGDVTPLSDWDKKQKEIKLNVARLSEDVVVSKASLDRAQLNSVRADTELKAAESKLAELKIKLTEATSGNLPTQESLRSLVFDAEKSVLLARSSSDSAKNLVVIEQNKVRSAEDALTAYVRENGRGE